MKKAILAAAISVMVLAFAEPSLGEPCCHGADINGEEDVRCHEGNIPGGEPPQGAGCDQVEGAACVGGGQTESGVSGCVCVGPVCVSGDPSNPDGLTVETEGYAACAHAAVTGCDAAGATAD